VSDLKDEIAARAVVSAGKEAAKRALDEILPPEKDAAGSEEKGKESSSRRWWIIAGVIAAVLIVVGVIGLVLTYWKWFLLAGVLGLGALYGYYRARSRLRDRKKQPKQAAEAQKVRVETTSKTSERSEEDRAATDLAAKERAADIARLRELEAQRDAAAEREARAAREREVEDELAAMKARIKRDG